MNTPTELLVAPHRVSIVFESDPRDDEDNPVFGTFRNKSLRIVVESDCSDSLKAETLLHEVLHALNASSPFAAPAEEERVITALAPALLRLMHDNPDFFPFLQRQSPKP